METQTTSQESAQAEAIGAIHEINGQYQDIEIILNSDNTPQDKLRLIAEHNSKIGDITGPWI